MVDIKRVYEVKSSSDGYRVLVDRLWPRGVSKEKAAIDLWMKDIGPSNELRRWFNHDPAKWAGFKNKYKTELKAKPSLLKQLKDLESEHKALTLIYGARDTAHNQAVVITEVLSNEN